VQKKNPGGSVMMIRECDDTDFEIIYAIINEAAQRYQGVIPEDCWKRPYMSRKELQHEIDADVVFWGYEEDGELMGVMGIQHVQDVTLIRHAYVRPQKQQHGIGKKLLNALCAKPHRPMLIGTWADAEWAIRFYQKHGFGLVTREEKNRLLEKYWTISARQADASVVLADRKWFDINLGEKAGG
jgi:N-acetylglutamate synthase-like GNAT family acetyltransferase